MRRIDDLPIGEYELELLCEERAGRAALSTLSNRGGRLTGGASRRIFRVVGTSEEVEDEHWQTLASPGARFRAQVSGVGAVTLTRL